MEHSVWSLLMQLHRAPPRRPAEEDDQELTLVDAEREADRGCPHDPDIPPCDTVAACSKLRCRLVPRNSASEDATLARCAAVQRQTPENRKTRSDGAARGTKGDRGHSGLADRGILKLLPLVDNGV
jgi:hypothetical protein